MKNSVQQCESVEPLAADATPPKPAVCAAPEEDLIESELLIEEVSIDGMCGVY